MSLQILAVLTDIIKGKKIGGMKLIFFVVSPPGVWVIVLDGRN
jgi:hypothetical protein